jgi:hypothetical protein
MSVFTPVTLARRQASRHHRVILPVQSLPAASLTTVYGLHYTVSETTNNSGNSAERRRGPCYLRLRAGRRGVRSPDGGKRFASRPKRPDQLRSPPSLGFLWGCIGLGDSRPTTRHHLALKFAMRASVLQSPRVQLYLLDGQQARAFVRTKLLPA